MRTLRAAASVFAALVMFGTDWVTIADESSTKKADDKPALLKAPFDAKTAQARQQDWAKHLGKKSHVEENSLGMKLVFIPPGEFMMGSSDADIEKFLRADASLKKEDFAGEQPQHRVRISKGFYVGMHEVTQAEYERVMGDNPSCFSKREGGKDEVAVQDTSRFPVEKIPWGLAQEFIRRLNASDAEKRAGRHYRLPTEAEWEYACRAGTTTAFHFGDMNNGRDANVDGNYPFGTTTKGPNLKRTTSVGSYKANAFGLFDMHGNVGEWCNDYYDKDFYAKRFSDDPCNNTKQGAGYQVVRGGPWDGGASSARAADRYGVVPGGRGCIIGFRVCCD